MTETGSPFLSVCIITKNEERFIEQCIKSILPIADEIIVVDAYSTDNTIRILQKYPVRVLKRKWNDDFAAARNYALDKSNGQWILCLDADEKLEHPKRILDELLSISSPDLGGLMLERLDVYRQKQNQKITHYSVGIVRVFRNLTKLRFKYKIHEQVNTSILRSGMDIKVHSASKIIHHVHHSSDEQLDNKQKYYLKLLNKELKVNQDDPWLLYHKAKTLWYFDRLDQAKMLFESVATNHNAPLDLKASSYNQIGLLYLEGGEYAKADQSIENSLELVPNQSMAWFIKYHSLYEQEKFKKAREVLKKVNTDITRCEWNSVIPGDLYCHLDIWHYKVGCCFLAEDQVKHAEAQFLAGIDFNQDSSDNYYGLTICLLRQGDILAANEKISKCVKYNPNWRQAKELKNIIDAQFEE